MTLFLLVLAAVVLMTAVSGISVFVIGCVRRKELPWLVQEEIEKTPYKKYSKQIRDADKWLADHEAQDLWVKSHDGLTLHGLWIPAKDPKGTVLFAHGYRSTMLLDFGMAFDYYYDRNMNLLIPDQRSHGKSEGRFITFGVLESRDMQTWIRYHNEKFGEYPMLLSGLSMGSSTMLYLADRSLPDNVRGIIADCGFTSPEEIISSVFKDVTHLPPWPSIMITEICARWIAKFSLRGCDTRKSLAHSRLPVLIVHGKEDNFVPCLMSQQAYDACSSEKYLLLVDQAGHGVSFLVEPVRYKQMIVNFLNKNILKLEETDGTDPH